MIPTNELRRLLQSMLMAKTVTPAPGHAATRHGPHRGRQNDELQVRGSPSRLGLYYRAHQRSRIYGRNRFRLTSGYSQPCVGAGSIYDGKEALSRTIPFFPSS